MKDLESRNADESSILNVLTHMNAGIKVMGGAIDFIHPATDPSADEPFEFSYRELQRIAKDLMTVGVLAKVPLRDTSAALKRASQVALNTGTNIYSLGARDLILISRDLQIEDIRYALTRAACPIGKKILNLNVFTNDTNS